MNNNVLRSGVIAILVVWVVGFSGCKGDDPAAPSDSPMKPAEGFRLLGPRDDDAGLGITVKLTWTSFGQVSPDQTQTYRVEVATDSRFISVVESVNGVSDTSYSTRPLRFSTKYYWRVTALNERSEPVASTGVWSFTTAGNATVDYFPWAISDSQVAFTIRKGFSHAGEGEMIQGRCTWVFTGPAPSVYPTTRQFLSVFEGVKITYGYKPPLPYTPYSDTVAVPPDSCWNTLELDANGQATMRFQGHLSYFGAVTFPRFYPESWSETTELTMYSTTLQLRRGVGLMYLNYWSGPGNSQAFARIDRIAP